MSLPIFLSLLCLALSSAPRAADGHCWGAGKNPGFSGAPRVSQVSVDRVRVDWAGLVTSPDCADNFVVKFWQRAAPGDYHITEIVPKDARQVEIPVQPRVSYLFQAVAREEKGVIGGVEWNKSPPARFKTSPTSMSSSTSTSSGALSVAGGGRQSSKRFFGLGVELFAAAVAAGAILICLIVGVVYKLACSRKSGEEEDDDEVEGKEEEERLAGADEKKSPV